MTRIYLFPNERDSVGRRQLLIKNLDIVLLMDLSNKGLSIDSPPIRGRELEEFTRKFNLLTPEELRNSLVIDKDTFFSILNQCVTCVGCRRRVELLFRQLISTGHPTLDPLVFKNSLSFTLSEEKLQSPQALGTVLYRHHEILNNVLENKPRNKPRCMIHSMEAFRAKPFSETWREVWFSMKHNCRDEMTIIDMKELHECIDTYLRKHKFCQGCREKIEKAYKILVGDINSKDKGFVPALYANFRKCQEDKHLHIVTTKTDFLDALIQRAEPELNGNNFAKHRERHAKTLEIAQEEVLTCVGMIIYDRLRHVYVNLHEGERACQVLAALGIHALCRSFDTAVEKKQGISNLEVLYQEISRAERAKELKKELKKLKKKQKKNEKKERKNSQRCSSTLTIETEKEGDTVTDVDADEAVDVSGDDDLDEDSHIIESLIAQSLVSEVTTPTVSSKKHKRKQKMAQKQLHKEQVKEKEKLCVTSTSDALPLTLPALKLTEKCEECLEPKPDCPCDVKDSGYGSEPNSTMNSRTSTAVSTPEGSVVSCSDGFCNHEHGQGNDLDDYQSLQQCDDSCDHTFSPFALSLQKMLDNTDEFENDDGDNIPPEVVLKYQLNGETIQQERLRLRAALKQNFDRLCIEKRFPLNKC